MFFTSNCVREKKVPSVYVGDLDNLGIGGVGLFASVGI